jgi:hypothetical protein
MTLSGWLARTGSVCLGAAASGRTHAVENLDNRLGSFDDRDVRPDHNFAEVAFAMRKKWKPVFA